MSSMSSTADHIQQHQQPLQPLQQTQQQQHQHGCLPLPTNRTNRVALWATAALVLAAVAAVAIAVPVAAAAKAPANSSSTSSDGSRLLAAFEGSSQKQSSSRGVQQEAGSRQLQGPVCQGVAGLCKVPVRFVTFPGTHNSNALKTNFASVAQHQQLTFGEQLQAGGRLFDIDYAGGRFGAKFGHCMGCLCAFSQDEKENDPVQVFKTMADFLASNPREVIVIGLSNINCGDKAAARQQLLGLLASSPLLQYAATQAIGPATTLGELVDSNQRAVFLFYDEWTTPTGYQIASKFVPNQALWRIYGGSSSVDGKDPATIDAQVSSTLRDDVINQISAPQPSLTISTPWRVMGLFPSTCLVCRAASVCGPISCAEKANSESFVLYILGKATARWTRSRSDQTQLVPAFNGFQIDYLQPLPKANVVTAAAKVNRAAAWMYSDQAIQAPKLGLGNCVFILDDTTASGGIACVADGTVKVLDVLGLPAAAAGSSAGGSSGRRLQQQQQQQDEAGAGSSSRRYILVPANPSLTLRITADGKLRKEVQGLTNQVQLLDLSLTATDLQLLWQ